MYQGLHFILLQFSFIQHNQSTHVSDCILFADIESDFAGKLFVIAYPVFLLEEFINNGILIVNIF